MKKLTVCLVAVILCAAAVLTGCSKSDGHDGYKMIANDACDFYFYVPETWTVSLSDGTVAAYCSPADMSSISVMPGELEYANSTVEDWWETYKTDFAAVYSEFTLLEEYDAALDGAAGKCFVFTGKLGENTYRFDLTAVLKHSRLYMLTFTSTPALYENHTDTLDDMKEFFKFR